MGGHNSFMQTSFLGGEWSKPAQGRMDSEHYKIGLNRCYNYYPIEEGALVRRQGFRYIAHTKGGAVGRLIAFDFSVTTPYQIELTDGYARFFRGTSLVFESPSVGIVDISTATPAVVRTGVAHGWTTGNTVVLTFETPPCRASLLCNRQFTITVGDTTSFSLADAVTGDPINGSDVDYSPVVLGDGDLAYKVLELTTIYGNGTWSDVRKVQDATTVLLLHPDYHPQVIQEGGSFFTIGNATFTDGPYLDENVTTTTLTPSATSGSVTITASSTTGINDGDGFAASDVGRLVRLRSQPAAYSGATTYAAGDLVTGSDGQVYTSLADSNTAHNPVNDVVHWSVSTAGLVWTYGAITAVGNTTVCTVLIAGDTLSNTTATTHWRLGLFSDTTGWPTCGAYHEGRLWLGGVLGNRVDASKSGVHYNFSPTSSDGTVADDNAIAAIFDAVDVNQVFWMISQEDGLYCGTQAGEWRVRASSLDDPITPSSVQARRPTTFGSDNQEAVTTPAGILFTQRQKRKVFEFDGTSGPKPTGTNISLTASHLTAGGINELAWQQEPQPTCWARRADGALIGCSYLHDPTKFYAAWHQHAIALERTVVSVSAGPQDGGLTDSLYAVTVDANADNPVYWVEMLTDLFDDSKEDWEAFFLDHGMTPCCVEELLIANGDDIDGLRFHGLWPLLDQSVTPFIGGVDLGDYTVAADGSIDVAYGADDDGVFTYAFLQALTAEAVDFGGFEVVVDHGSANGAAVAIGNYSIMSYYGDNSVVSGWTTTIAFPGWDSNLFHVLRAGNATTGGIRQFHLDADGNQTSVKTCTTLGIFELTVGGGNAGALATDEDTFVVVSTGGNFQQIALFDAATDTLLGVRGTPGAFAPGNTSDRLPGPHALTTIEVGGVSTDIVAGYFGAGQEVDFIPFTTAGMASVQNLGNMTGAGHTFGSIFSRGSYGSSHGLTYALSVPGNVSAAHHLHSINSGPVLRDIGNFTGPDVDATWVGIQNANGMWFDEYDGNVILNVGASNVGPTNTQYIIKLSSRDGSILWTYPVGDQLVYNNSGTFSRIRNSTLFFAESSGGTVLLHTIDTRDGTGSSLLYPGLSIGGAQYSDDVTNSVVLYGGFNAAAAGSGGKVPAYLGQHMGVDAVHTVSAIWMRIFVGTVTGQPRRPLTTERLVAPAIIGCVYDSEGQLLRPDFGQDAGARAGAAFSKKRRVHQYGMGLYRTRSMTIGYTFDDLTNPVRVVDAGEVTTLPAPELKSGVVADTLEMDYSYDGQIAWRQSRAYPGIITAVAGHIETEDR